MRKVVDAELMREIDREAIETYGIPSMVLMERAAYSVYEEIVHLFNKKDSMLCICGYGNNGADGIAVARMLQLSEYNVQVYMYGNPEHATEENMKQQEIAKKVGVRFITSIEPDEYNVIVDALLGNGFKGKLKAEYISLFERVNRSENKVIAVDVPSGVNATSGEAEFAIKADVTVTFGYVKSGLLLFPASEYAGKIKIADIGFPKIQEDRFSIYTSYDNDNAMLKLLPARNPASNKGTYGKVLVIAGNRNVSGAAYLSAAAAYYMGAGLVRIFTDAANREVLAKLLPEAMIITDISCLQKAIETSSVVLIGPGIGTEEYAAELVQITLRTCKVPLVADADAINILAELMTKECKSTDCLINDESCAIVEKSRFRMKKLDELLCMDVVLTPHVLELSRLTGMPVADIKKDMLGNTGHCTEGNRFTLVKKDARTIVSNGGIHYINMSGCNGMSTGGSGDVLSGMIAGIIATQGADVDVYKAATAGVWLHGLAGEKAQEKKGARSMLAGDILEAIPEILKNT